MIPLNAEQLKELEEARRQYGNDIAHPMLRSMWPMYNRGTMADLFAAAFEAGALSDFACDYWTSKVLEMLRSDEAFGLEMHDWLESRLKAAPEGKQ